MILLIFAWIMNRPINPLRLFSGIPPVDFSSLAVQTSIVPVQPVSLALGLPAIPGAVGATLPVAWI